MEENKIIETIDEEGNPVRFELYNIIEAKITLSCSRKMTKNHKI